MPHTEHLEKITPYSTILTVDWETFYDTASGYSLSSKKMTAESYINDPRFEAILVGVKVNSQPTTWKATSDVDFLEWLHSFPWETSVVVAHNGAFFDFPLMAWKYGIVCGFYICTLLLARPLNGDKRSNSLKALAERYGLPAKGDEVIYANGKRLADFSTAELEAYGAYCCLDNDLCYAILGQLLQHWTPYTLRWMNLTIRMYAVPQFKLDTKILEDGIKAEVRKEGKQLSDLEIVLEESGYEFPLERRRGEDNKMGMFRIPMKKLVGSGDHFADILRHLGVEPPLKLSEQKLKTARQKREENPDLPPIKNDDVMSYAFARTDEFVQSVLENGHDLKGVSEAIQARVGVKSTIMFSRLTRMLGTGQRMGCIPMPIRPFGAHCVPGETEVLTPEGWVRLDAWNGGEIMQFDAARDHLRFLPATVYKGPIIDRWVIPPERSGHAPMTDGHRVPYYADSPIRKVLEIPASELANRSRTSIVESGIYIGRGRLSPNAARILAMVQADGQWVVQGQRRPSIRFRFKKERKIRRCAELLENEGIVFSRHVHESGVSQFYIGPDAIPEWLTIDRKIFGPWILRDMDAYALYALVDEVTLWDGSRKSDGCYKYSSNIRANVEWVATAAHCCGMRATRVRTEPNRQWAPMYVVALRSYTGGAIISGVDISESHERMRAWCAQTRTGFWLARYRGKCFITGNTGRASGAEKNNPQNYSSRPTPSNPLGKANPTRLAIKAPEGHVCVDIDQGQIEVRVSGGLAGEHAIIDSFADPDADPYCIFGETLYSRPIIKGVDKFERNVAKSAVLGNGFGQGAMGFQGYCRRSGIILDLEECERIVRIYRQANLELVAFWKECEWALNRIIQGYGGTFGYNGCLKVVDGGILLPSGRLQRYPQLHTFQKWDDRYEREVTAMRFYDPMKVMFREVYGSLCCENLTQGTAADIVFEQAVDIAYETGFYPALQCHDALTWVVRKTDLPRLLSSAKRIMQTPRKWMDWIPLAVEADIGPSYGSMVEEEKYFAQQ